MLSLSVLPAIFLNLNKALLLLSAGKLKIATLVFEVGSYLQYCSKLPDVF